MTRVAARLLSELERHQVRVILEGDRLSIRGRGRALPLDLRAELREHRADLVAELERREAGLLPLLVLYRAPSGAEVESWLLVPEAQDLAAELARLGARVAEAGPWVRADLPRGATPPDLVAELLERHGGRLRLPSRAELEARATPLAPSPSPSPPKTCPSCRGSAGWVLLQGGAHLCRRCGSPAADRAPPGARVAA